MLFLPLISDNKLEEFSRKSLQFTKPKAADERIERDDACINALGGRMTQTSG